MSDAAWTPRRSIEQACDAHGRDAVVAACTALVTGRPAPDAIVLALGGEHARSVLAMDEPGVHAYWLRVWGMRGLLWAWDDGATDVVVQAMSDEAWRVREMACKVVARHRVGEALDAVGGLASDPVPRVRAAAQRAAEAVVASGA